MRRNVPQKKVACNFFLYPHRLTTDTKKIGTVAAWANRRKNGGATGCGNAGSASNFRSRRPLLRCTSIHGRRFRTGKRGKASPSATDYGNAASINCRGVGQINTPDGEPFVQFVRKAFIDELKLAEAFSPSGPISISGRLDAIDFSSVATGEASHGQPRAPGLPEPERTPPHWSIMLTLKSSNGRSLTVSDTFAFAENYVGDIACQQTALAFVPAVQNIIGKVVHSPDFRSLLTP